MIYEKPAQAEFRSQGDIFDDCPILFWDYPTAGAELESSNLRVRVVAMTHACDLAPVRVREN